MMDQEWPGRLGAYILCLMGYKGHIHKVSINLLRKSLDWIWNSQDLKK